jgi:hypothetical protein
MSDLLKKSCLKRVIIKLTSSISCNSQCCSTLSNMTNDIANGLKQKENPEDKQKEKPEDKDEESKDDNKEIDKE